MNKVKDRLVLTNKLVARNRIVMPPMDTLMSEDGMANDFHIQHYGARAYGGVGTIVVESTAVAEEGKIRPRDLGIWKDEQIAPLAKVAIIAKQANAIIGIQLNHAGAKAEDSPIETFGPTNYYSHIRRTKYRLMNENDLAKVENDFVSAAKRAKAAGFDFVEIHGAHGYLINQLLHPVLNEVFGANDVVERAQFLIRIIDRIAAEVDIPTGIRFSITDHDVNGVDEEYYLPLIKLLSDKVIYFNISSGEAISSANIGKLIAEKGTKMFRIDSAKKVKAVTNKIVFTGGNASTKKDVQEVLDAGIDAVFVGRELLFNPNLVVTDLIEISEDREKDYHWNNNVWYSHFRHQVLMKSLKKK